MRITIIGAAGNMGQRITAEAVTRGHDVSAAVRAGGEDPVSDYPVRFIHGDATKADDVLRFCSNTDVVVAATRPRSGFEFELVKTTALLLKTLAHSTTRLLISGGAASLEVPDREQRLLLHDSRYMPRSVMPIGQACVQQLQLCRSNDSVDWTYLSPSALLMPGERTNNFRLGEDELLTDASGRSMISMEDLAVALVDEIEQPRHIRRRFTAGY